MFKLLNSQVLLTTICIFFSFSFFNQVGYDFDFDNDVEDFLRISSIDLDIKRENGAWVKVFDVENSNFLITGHSFHIYPFKKGVFHDLESVSIGDDINVSFDGFDYVYEVFDTYVVSFDELHIENLDDEKNLLRVYTCYPKWSNLKRFVVDARRVVR